MTYRAPLADIGFALKYAAGLPQAIEDGLFGYLAMADVEAVLSEAGRFASEVIAPLNPVGDRFGTPFDNGTVTMPPISTASRYPTLLARNRGPACDGVT